MPYFARLAATKRPIPLGATVRFERSAEPVPYRVVVSAGVFGPPAATHAGGAKPSADIPRSHEPLLGQVWDYATPRAAWVVLPDRTARLVAVRDMTQVDEDAQLCLALPAGLADDIEPSA
jgi:hypothetical protein